MEGEDQPVVFAFFVGEEFKGFRADTFNTITQDHPKIYTYSKEQVEIVIKGIKESCNRIGTAFAKFMKDRTLISNEGEAIDGNTLVDHISKNEKLLQEWNMFDVRVIPFLSREEWHEMLDGDEWKKKAVLETISMVIPLETHSFKIVDNPN